MTAPERVRDLTSTALAWLLVVPILLLGLAGYVGLTLLGGLAIFGLFLTALPRLLWRTMAEVGTSRLLPFYFLMAVLIMIVLVSMPLFMLK